MKVRELLRDKGPMVFTLAPDQPVRAAVSMLATHNIGSVLIVEEGMPVGILTERDILRLCHEDGTGSFDRSIASVMTRDIIIGDLEDEVSDLLCVVTEKRIRHIPIMQEGRLAGLVSIGDLVKSQVSAQGAEIRYLRDYISGI